MPFSRSTPQEESVQEETSAKAPPPDDSAHSSAARDAAAAQSSSLWSRFLWWIGLAACIGVGIWLLRGAPTDDAPVRGPVVTGDEDAASSERTLEDALQIAHRALEGMEETLVDYRGRVVKRERVAGVLGEENEMAFKIRSRRETANEHGPVQTMAVYLRFLRPASAAGREVIWVQGANDNKLIAHEAGFAGLIRVYLDPTGFIAMRGNLHPISEIGFKNLVRQLIERGKLLTEAGGADVRFIEDHLVGDRECLLIQVRPRAVLPQSGTSAVVDFALAEIAFDQQRGIPLRYAAYGPPTEGGTELSLLEEYTYLDVELNVGLTEQDFDPDNPEYEYP